MHPQLERPHECPWGLWLQRVPELQEDASNGRQRQEVGDASCRAHLLGRQITSSGEEITR